MTLSQAILATLRYSDHFDFPLTFSELSLRLIHQKPKRSQLQIELNRLLASNKLASTPPYYYLKGRSSLVALRTARAKISRSKLVKLKAVLPRLAQFPGILAIYLTGSLAMLNADSHHDYDLLIITHNNRLWLTRLLLTLYTEFLGLRRRPHAKSAPDQLCFNLYLTPASFTLPLSKRSLYTAYELIQAKPLYDPYHTHPLLLAANPWLKTYLPNFIFPAVRGIIPFPARLHSPIELISYRFQAWYMRKHLTTEYITPTSAFFHPRDPSPAVK